MNLNRILPAARSLASGTVACCVLVAGLSGCVAGNGAAGGSSGSGNGAPAVIPATLETLVAKGGFTAVNPDGKTVTVDYSKANVTVTMAHKQTTETLACVPVLTIAAELPTTTKSGVTVGMCKLQLDFKAGFAGEGLQLAGAKFYAKQGIYSGKDLIDKVDCVPWGTAEPANSEVAYEYVPSSTPPTIGMSTIGQPYGNQVEAKMDNVLLQPMGSAVMKYKGRQFTIDLAAFSVKGPVTSKGDPNLACVKTFHDLPSWKLPDINPKSSGYNAEYGLEAFKGKRTVMMMGAGWCAACVAQAKIMEKIRLDMEAKGRSDVALAALIDTQQPKEMLDATAIPLFAGAWTVHKQALPDGSADKVDKGNAYAYDYDGRCMGYFQGADTIYTNKFEDFVRAMLNAPKEQPSFMTCLVGGKPDCTTTAN